MTPSIELSTLTIFSTISFENYWGAPIQIISAYFCNASHLKFQIRELLSYSNPEPKNLKFCIVNIKIKLHDDCYKKRNREPTRHPNYAFYERTKKITKGKKNRILIYFLFDLYNQPYIITFHYFSY